MLLCYDIKLIQYIKMAYQYAMIFVRVKIFANNFLKGESYFNLFYNNFTIIKKYWIAVVFSSSYQSRIAVDVYSHIDENRLHTIFCNSYTNAILNGEFPSAACIKYRPAMRSKLIGRFKMGQPLPCKRLRNIAL